MPEHIKFESLEKEPMIVNKGTVRELFYNVKLGLNTLDCLNKSEMALLSKRSFKALNSVVLVFMNILDCLKELETTNIMNDPRLRKKINLNQSVDIKIFIRGLCRKVTDVLGSAANLKVNFTSELSKNTIAMCDWAVFQFVILNVIAVIASNTDKDKKVINISLAEDENDNVQIKIWNKYSFRIKKKVIDESDILEMYKSDYDFEQMINISHVLLTAMNGDAGCFIEDDILKISLVLSKYNDEMIGEVYELEDSEIDALNLLVPFSNLLFECISNSDDETDNSEIIKLIKEVLEN